MLLGNIVLAYTLAAAADPAGSPYRHTLVNEDTWQIDHRQVTPGSPPWTIRKQTLHGGRQEGVAIVTIEAGLLKVVVSPTRGMSVLEVRSGDVRLGWDSPVKEVVHPQWIDLGSRGGLGWLDGFNEWLVRCGLEWAGHPGRDGEMDLSLHGRIGNLPASEVEVLVERQAPFRIRLRGRVAERTFHGPQLELVTELSVEPGSRGLRIDDTVTNRAGVPQEMQVIYHANYGAPLLGPGARFRGAVARVTPFDGHAATGVASYETYGGPAPGAVEQVYCLEPLAGPDGKTTIMLESAGGDRAVSMTFAVAELPYVTLWKNTAALEDGYVTGLEPGTGFPYNRRIERAHGRVPRLAPGASRHFGVEIGVLSDKDQVSGATARIAALQQQRRPIIDRSPSGIADAAPNFRPDGKNAWDFWFAKSGGTYHAFYLEYPDKIAKSDQSARHTRQWVGHAVSTDLLNWTPRPTALTEAPDLGIATGSCVRDGDRWYMLLTHRGFTLAESEDLERWRWKGKAQFPEKLTARWQGETLGFRMVADPYIYPSKLDGWWYAAINSQIMDVTKELSGAQVLMRSKDLLHWETYKIICYPKQFERLETAQIWNANGKWYLLFGAVGGGGGTRVWIADRFDGPYEERAWSKVTLPGIQRFYLGKRVVAPDGTDVFLAGESYAALSRPFRMTYLPGGEITYGR